MCKIISIATSVPKFRHLQKEVVPFMQSAYAIDDEEKRKLSFLYARSAINIRHSVVNDFSLPKEEWSFFPAKEHTFPTLNQRLKTYKKEALPLALKAVEDCIEGFIKPAEITHLITLSCTGMSAPGLDLELMEVMNLKPDIFRTSVNFMGCYAAVHALKIGKMICDGDANANVVIVSCEICTIHFQENFTSDNVGSGLLFSDGCAAILLSNNIAGGSHLKLKNFYSYVAGNGKKDMAWEIGGNGFMMTLSGYIPQLVEQDISMLVDNALKAVSLNKEDITHWCIHPGGKKIIDVIEQKLSLHPQDLSFSRNILYNYGNMSSANILFVLKDIIENIKDEKAKVFGVAFGPGLTMETFIATTE